MPCRPAARSDALGPPGLRSDPVCENTKRARGSGIVGPREGPPRHQARSWINVTPQASQHHPRLLSSPLSKRLWPKDSGSKAGNRSKPLVPLDSAFGRVAASWPLLVLRAGQRPALFFLARARGSGGKGWANGPSSREVCAPPVRRGSLERPPLGWLDHFWGAPRDVRDVKDRVT